MNVDMNVDINLENVANVKLLVYTRPVITHFLP